MGNWGYREIFKFDGPNLKQLNDTLRALWTKVMGGIDMKDLDNATREVINNKVSSEVVNELGETVAQHSTQFTQTETEIRSVAQSVTKLGETVTSHSTAIEQNSQEISLKANKGDPVTGLNNEAGVVINANGVYVSGGEISLATSDGSEYVNITGEGVSASGISAPNVAPRYAGPPVITVNPGATDAQVKAGTHVKSLQSAVAMVNGKCLAHDVYIEVTAGTATYGDVEVRGVFGTGGVNIAGLGSGNAQLYGRIIIKNCGTRVGLQNLTVRTATGSAVSVESAVSVLMALCEAHSVSGNGVSVGLGGNMTVSGCALSGATNAGYVSAGGIGFFIGTTGSGRLYCSNGIMIASGSVPSGGATWSDSFVPNSDLTADGTGGSSSAVSTTTAEYLMQASDSYAGGWSYFGDNDPRQGYVSGGGRIRGCIWFANGTIRSALSGRTIRQATLRLHQLGDYGRGVAVGVQLYGTSASGASGTPALTKSYGTIGTTEPGVSSEMTIPTAAVSDLVSGTINGLMLYSEDTGVYKDRDYSKNYARFSTEDGQQPRLTVVYS